MAVDLKMLALRTMADGELQGGVDNATLFLRGVPLSLSCVLVCTTIISIA